MLREHGQNKSNGLSCCWCVCAGDLPSYPECSLPGLSTHQHCCVCLLVRMWAGAKVNTLLQPVSFLQARPEIAVRQKFVMAIEASP